MGLVALGIAPVVLITTIVILRTVGCRQELRQRRTAIADSDSPSTGHVPNFPTAITQNPNPTIGFEFQGFLSAQECCGGHRRVLNLENPPHPLAVRPRCRSEGAIEIPPPNYQGKKSQYRNIHVRGICLPMFILCLDVLNFEFFILLTRTNAVGRWFARF